MKKKTYKILGVVGAVVILLGLTASLNPDLFKGFILGLQGQVIQNECDEVCGLLQNEALEALTGQGTAVSGVGDDGSVATGISYQKPVDFDVLRDRLSEVNDRCGCNGMRDVFIKGMGVGQDEADALLTNLGFSCSQVVYTNECEVPPSDTPNSCPALVDDIITKRLNGDMSEKEMKTLLIQMYSGVGFGFECGCDPFFEIMDALGYSIEEANTFAVQSDVIRCRRQPQRLTCEDYAAKAIDQINQEPDNVWDAIQNNVVVNDCSCEYVEMVAENVDRGGKTVAEYLEYSDHVGCGGNTPPPSSCGANRIQDEVGRWTGELVNDQFRINNMSTLYEQCGCQQVKEVLKGVGKTTDEINSFLNQAGLEDCADQPKYNACDMAQAAIIVNLADQTKQLPSNYLIDSLASMGADCGCEKVEPILDWIGHDQEGKNAMYDAINMPQCKKTPEPDPTPTCEDHRANAYRSLQDYKETASHEDLANALESMLLLDTECCDFCTNKEDEILRESQPAPKGRFY